MLELKRCPECQAPLKLSKSLKWNSGGEAYPRRSGTVRQIFFEPDVINAIFSKISKTISMPIDHIVIESGRRDTVDFFREYYPAWMLKICNSLYEKTSDKGFGKILGKIMFHLTDSPHLPLPTLTCYHDFGLPGTVH